jgi:MFS transporter, putative metabolite:H+ symporter
MSKISTFLSDFRAVLKFPVIVAGLGYFVDMFDITLFGVVRGASLKSMNITDPAELLSTGVRLYNLQMIGMMLGGLLWGVLGDKRGRLSVLFGSILVYSIGNILNAFVTDPTQYAICRFVTGFGLAGELGAAITLISEQLDKNQRGLGTTLIATMGLSGCVAAAFFGQRVDWTTAYLIGGGMGLLLLLARFKMFESSAFKNLSLTTAARGELSMLFKAGRFRKYLACILVGVPIYFVTGVLMTFAPELTAGLGISGVNAGNALLMGTIGLTVGDLLSGVLSQILRKRRQALAIFITGAMIFTGVYLFKSDLTADGVYLVCLVLGIFSGYWAVLVTVAAEQFGTNLRATVATTVPNFVRGSAALTTSLFLYGKELSSTRTSALAVGGFCFIVAMLALWSLRETFGKDLDYVE